MVPALDDALYISAAEDESSWASDKNVINIVGFGNIFLIDEFTQNFIESIEDKPSQSFYSLFTSLYDRTLVSHPKLFNCSNYGNLLQLSFKDYLDE